MKPILMIHEVDESIFELPLHEYILTFDDGLYTQYVFLEDICKIETDKYFFISTDIVCPVNVKQKADYIRSPFAHEHYFINKNREYFMNWNQIREISQIDRCHIGGHSHTHRTLMFNKIPINYIITDTNEMIQKFKFELGYIPKHFCFPYNYSNTLYEKYIDYKQFDTSISSSRIDISKLISKYALAKYNTNITYYKWNCV